MDKKDRKRDGELYQSVPRSGCVIVSVVKGLFKV